MVSLFLEEKNLDWGESWSVKFSVVHCSQWVGPSQQRSLLRGTIFSWPVYHFYFFFKISEKRGLHTWSSHASRKPLFFRHQESSSQSWMAPANISHRVIFSAGISFEEIHPSLLSNRRCFSKTEDIIRVKYCLLSCAITGTGSGRDRIRTNNRGLGRDWRTTKRCSRSDGKSPQSVSVFWNL